MKWKSSEKLVLKLNCVKKLTRTLSRTKEKNLDSELRESQSTVNRLAHQIRELHEMINSLSESQDFKDLETASSSGSTHAPGKPSVFPSFQTFPAATSATIVTHPVTVV